MGMTEPIDDEARSAPALPHHRARDLADTAVEPRWERALGAMARRLGVVELRLEVADDGIALDDLAHGTLRPGGLLPQACLEAGDDGVALADIVDGPLCPGHHLF